MAFVVAQSAMPSFQRHHDSTQTKPCQGECNHPRTKARDHEDASSFSRTLTKLAIKLLPEKNRRRRRRQCAIARKFGLLGVFVKAKLALKSSSPTTGHLAKADAVVVVEHTH
jgi:hypothetical protein